MQSFNNLKMYNLSRINYFKLNSPDIIWQNKWNKSVTYLSDFAAFRMQSRCSIWAFFLVTSNFSIYLLFKKLRGIKKVFMSSRIRTIWFWVWFFFIFIPVSKSILFRTVVRLSYTDRQFEFIPKLFLQCKYHIRFRIIWNIRFM